MVNDTNRGYEPANRQQPAFSFNTNQNTGTFPQHQSSHYSFGSSHNNNFGNVPPQQIPQQQGIQKINHNEKVYNAISPN